MTLSLNTRFIFRFVSMSGTYGDLSIFTNVDAGCQPPRKKESVFLCNNLSRLNKSEFILFTFVFKTNSISDHTHLREILLVSMQDKVIKVNHRLPLGGQRRVLFTD